MPPTGDLACNPGLGLDQELNRGLLGLQEGAWPLSHSSQGWSPEFLITAPSQTVQSSL